MSHSWLMPLIGGLMIGLAATILLWLNGRRLGVSGIVGGLLKRHPDGTSWRVAFFLGLLAVGWLAGRLKPDSLGDPPHHSLVLTAVAGLLVGIGTSLSGGCTSGHGVCGIARFSPRSIVATICFIAFGMLTVAALRLLGWSV